MYNPYQMTICMVFNISSKNADFKSPTKLWDGQSTYECPRCHYSTNTKSNYVRHLQKPIVCAAVLTSCQHVCFGAAKWFGKYKR